MKKTVRIAKTKKIKGIPPTDQSTGESLQTTSKGVKILYHTFREKERYDYNMRDFIRRNEEFELLKAYRQINSLDSRKEILEYCNIKIFLQEKSAKRDVKIYDFPKNDC